MVPYTFLIGSKVVRGVGGLTQTTDIAYPRGSESSCPVLYSFWQHRLSPPRGTQCNPYVLGKCERPFGPPMIDNKKEVAFCPYSLSMSWSSPDASLMPASRPCGSFFTDWWAFLRPPIVRSSCASDGFPSNCGPRSGASTLTRGRRPRC